MPVPFSASFRFLCALAIGASISIIGCSTDPGDGDTTQPPTVGGVVTVSIDTQKTLGEIQTTGGTNLTGLIVAAMAGASGGALLDDLSAIPFGLNRVHFTGEEPGFPDPEALFPQPNPPPAEWNLAPMDLVVTAARSIRDGNGTDFVFSVHNCPTWMTASGVPGSAPGDNSVYATYCARLVSYYNVGSFVDDQGRTVTNPNGTANRMNSWEIWNEPDINDFGGGGVGGEVPAFGNPADYRDLCALASVAMLAVDPTIKFCAPATSDPANHQSFLDVLTEAGIPVDMVAIHQYPGEDTDTDAMLFSEARNPSLVDTGGLPLSIGEINFTAYEPDVRLQRDIFELAYMPLAYLAHVENGTESVMRYQTTGATYALFDQMTGARTRRYWMERNFWGAVPGGASAVESISNSQNVKTFAVLKDGKLRVVLVNVGVAKSTDLNGAGLRNQIDVSGLPLSDYGVAVVDRNMDAVAGPTSRTDTNVTSVSVTIDGYGVAVITER